MKEISNHIVNAANFNESLTLLGFKDDGLLSLVSVIIDDIAVSTPAKVNKKVKFKKFSVSLVDKLACDTFEKKILDSVGFKQDDFASVANSLDKNENFIFIIYDLEKFHSPKKLIHIFDQLSKQYGKKLNFIYLLEDAEVFIDLESTLEPSSTFFENIYIHSLSGSEEKTILEDICVKQYGSISNKETLKKIFNDSYGHFELYKRLYKAAITKHFTSLDSYIKRLVSSFSQENLKIFRKVINKLDLSEKEKGMVEIYERLGFIQNNRIVIPALEKYIIDLAPKEDIFYDKENGKILLNTIENFTKSELVILRAFLENTDQIITKESLGEVIWGKKTDNKYSPWAIDQLIFKLRMKLEKYNIKGKIKTIHGKGYLYSEKG